MTKLRQVPQGGQSAVQCRWCRRAVAPVVGPGRPRIFCSQRCRQWDWVSRQRAADLALGSNEVVVGRDELDRLHDDLYMLAAAVEDIERDLAAVGRPSNKEFSEALEWLLAAAKPLCGREVSPAAQE